MPDLQSKFSYSPNKQQEETLTLTIYTRFLVNLQTDTVVGSPNIINSMFILALFIHIPSNYSNLPHKLHS